MNNPQQQNINMENGESNTQENMFRLSSAQLHVGATLDFNEPGTYFLHVGHCSGMIPQMVTQQPRASPCKAHGKPRADICQGTVQRTMVGQVPELQQPMQQTIQKGNCKAAHSAKFNMEKQNRSGFK